jgi:cytochrome P450
MTEADAELDPAMMLFSPEAADAPHGPYQHLLDTCPVARSDLSLLTGEDVGSVLISGFENLAWALKHPEYISSEDAVSIGNQRPLIPLQVDPPEHAKYRRLLDPEFSPKKMAICEADFRALANEVIDKFIENGACDFHEDFATPLPSTFFLRIAGLPLSDLSVFLKWRDNIIRPDVEPGDFDAAAAIRDETGKQIYAYFDQAFDERAKNPDDGLLSRLMEAEVEGLKLTREELLDICYLLIIAGLDTVTATLDCMVHRLATHPDERQRLVDDPSIAPAVVEELMRFETPVMVVPRTVKQDVTIGDVELKAGDRVTMVLGAGNIDGDEFHDATTVDFDRGRNRHLAFGAGPHRCLGSHLARLEVQVALEEWHRRIPHYTVADGAEIHFSPGIRQVNSLPLVFEGDSA